MLLPPLLRRRCLLPDESLASLIIRLTEANCYDQPYILIGLALLQGAGQGYARDISANISQAATFERLKALTKIDYWDIYTATPHHFASVLTPPGIPIESLSISENLSVPLLGGGIAHVQLRPEYAAQFCPKCLRSLAYHRRIWTPIATSICLKHKCLLINRCPTCNKTIEVREIVKAHCSECSESFSGARTLYMGNDDQGLFSQNVVQSWLLGSNISCSYNALLYEQSPRTLYRFLDGLKITMMGLKTEWSYLHNLQIKMDIPASANKTKPQSLTPYQSYCLYTTAFKAISNWPAGFHEFLDEYRKTSPNSKPLGHALGYDLSKLYKWLERRWQLPEFAFVQDAFNSYVIDNYGSSHEIIKSSRYRNNPDLAQRFSTMTIDEAAKHLRTSPKVIKFLVRKGVLTEHTSNGANMYMRLDRAEVLNLDHEWKNGIGLAEVSRWLGISQDIVLDIVRVGLLTTDHSPKDGFVHWMFSKSAVAESFNKILENVKPCNENDPIVASLLHLPTASIIFGAKVGLNAAHMLLQIAQGRLRAYCLPIQNMQLRDLLFNRSDIEQCVEAYTHERNLVKRKEAQAILGVSDSTLARWVRRGLILNVSLSKSVQYFDRSEIYNFLSRHITTDEAADILEISRLAIQSMARAGYLEAVSGPGIDGHGIYLFNRDKLSKWRSYWLNDKEVMQLLNINSRGVLEEWIKQGKLRVLSPLNGCRRWFSKKVVLELLEDINT